MLQETFIPRISHRPFWISPHSAHSVGRNGTLPIASDSFPEFDLIFSRLLRNRRFTGIGSVDESSVSRRSVSFLSHVSATLPRMTPSLAVLASLDSLHLVCDILQRYAQILH